MGQRCSRKTAKANDISAQTTGTEINRPDTIIQSPRSRRPVGSRPTLSESRKSLKRLADYQTLSPRTTGGRWTPRGYTSGVVDDIQPLYSPRHGRSLSPRSHRSYRSPRDRDRDRDRNRNRNFDNSLMYLALKISSDGDTDRIVNVCGIFDNLDKASENARTLHRGMCRLQSPGRREDVAIMSALAGIPDGDDPEPMCDIWVFEIPSNQGLLDLVSDQSVVFSAASDQAFPGRPCSPTMANALYCF